jgi:hypothetical protein
MRSEAHTLRVVMGVTGSAVGLGIVSLLSNPLGLGPSISLLALLPLAALAIVAVAFPETTRRELEDTSGEQVSALRATEASRSASPR